MALVADALPCGDLARRVLVSGLLPLVDPADGRLLGLRRELYRSIAAGVGMITVGCSKRLLQFAEIDHALAELVGLGVVEDGSDGVVLDLKVSGGMDADCAE